MQTNINLLKIPGEVSINILSAVKKALAKVQRINRQPDYRRVKKGLAALKANRQQLLSLPIQPLKRIVSYKKPLVTEYGRDKIKRARRELLDAGVTLYGLIKSESRYLPKILHDNEHIEAVIYGQHQASSAMMVATDERIIYLDKKPMTALFDEVSYEVVSGIQFDIHLLFATVVLHTPVKNYDFRWVNLHCAEKFARHIETQRLEREQPVEEEAEVVEAQPADITVSADLSEYPSELKENMAGYYWLPTEEEDRRKAGVGPAEVI